MAGGGAASKRMDHGRDSGVQDALGGPRLTGIGRCAGCRQLGQHEAVQAQLLRNGALQYIRSDAVISVMLGRVPG